MLPYYDQNIIFFDFEQIQKTLDKFKKRFDEFSQSSRRFNNRIGGQHEFDRLLEKHH